MKPLSDDEIKKIYETVIRPQLLDPVKPSENKTCCFLGGQPGSGKSHLNDLCINALDNQDAIVIDTDLIRRHHPHTPKVAEKEIYILDQDCYKWGEMLIADSIKANKNVLFDATFGGNLENLQALMKRYKEAGYTIDLNLLAVNDTVSKIGFNYRYELSKQKFNTGRPVDSEYHDKIYSKIPFNLLDTLSKGLVDKFKIFTRNHSANKLEKVKDFNSSELKTDASKIVVEYVNERNRLFTENEIRSLKSWFQKTVSIIEGNGGNVKEFRRLFFNHDINASAKLKNQILEVIGLSKEEIKAIHQLRMDIEGKQALVERMKGHKDPDLKRSSQPVIENNEKLIAGYEAKIKNILDGKVKIPDGPVQKENIRAQINMK